MKAERGRESRDGRGDMQLPRRARGRTAGTFSLLPLHKHTHITYISDTPGPPGRC